jgi:hypothetical protein
MMRDGRLVEALRVPEDVYNQLEAEAQRRGQRIGVVAGDLIAEVLPAALAEAAAALLEAGREQLLRIEKSSELSPRALPSERVATLPSPTLPLRGPGAEPSGADPC